MSDRKPSIIQHCERSQKVLDALLKEGRTWEPDDLHAFALWEPFIDAGGSWECAAILEGDVFVYFQDHESGDNSVYSGVEIAHLKFYRIDKYSNVSLCGDMLSSDGLKMGEAYELLEDIDSESFEESILTAGHPYFLDDFQVKKEYQRKGLGYPCLHLGLQAAGCEGSTLLLIPSKRKKDAGFEFLKQFYMKMDMGTIWVEKHEVVCIPVYNCNDSVKYLRERKS